MEKIRTGIADFYQNRRREFMMVVFLLLLFTYNLFAYLSGDKSNLFAVMFGQRGAKKTAPQEQEQSSVPSQNVKEGMELESAAQEVGQGTTASAPSSQSPAPAPQESQKQLEITPSAQTPAPAENVTQTQPPPAVTGVAAKAVYEELGSELFYREDPFKPVVVPVKVQIDGGEVPPVARPVKKGPCGSLVKTAFPDSPFIWPTETAESSAGSGGLPALPGMDGEDAAEPEKTASSGGGIKLTGVIFDSQPVALIRFN